MSRNRAAVLIAAALAVLVVRAVVAAPLAPRKASDLVNLVGGGASCLSGTAVASQLDDAGNVTPFTIPADQVFVLTSLWTRVGNGVPGGTVTLYVNLEYPSGQIPLEGAEAVYGDTTVASFRMDFGSGVVIKPGTKLCVYFVATGTLSQISARGFLAKDK